MAVMDIRIFSKILNRLVTFKAIIPGDELDFQKQLYSNEFKRDVKTLYLLHGSEGDCSDYLYKTNILQLATQMNLAVIMPSGENSWYVNKEQDTARFKTFIGTELVDYVQSTFSLSTKKEDNFIGGHSMGGYGALCIGLTYPERFSKIFGMSPALVINDITSKGTLRTNEELKGFHYIFDSLDGLRDTNKNPENLIQSNMLYAIPQPKVFICCGKDDFLIEMNRDFEKVLKKSDIDYIYKETEGIHDWNYWSKWLEPSLKWLLDIEDVCEK
ncbi:MAG: alpha/beta hydrolase [Sphaerochaeta sp.]